MANIRANCNNILTVYSDGRARYRSRVGVYNLINSGFIYTTICPMNSPVRMASEFTFKWMPGPPILLRDRYRESLGAFEISYVAMLRLSIISNNREL
jgi:hypothetical protein